MAARPTSTLHTRTPQRRRGAALTCAALVRPGSPLYDLVAGAPPPGAYAPNATPAWGIYEYSPGFAEPHELRFGDGSGFTVQEAHLPYLVLLPEIGDAELDELFP